MTIRKSGSSRKKSTAKSKATVNIYEIEVFLAETEPRIWRRFEVSDDITLAKMHDMLQAVMGWYDCHLHHFLDMKETRYGPRDDDMGLEWDADIIEERKVKLRKVMPRKGSRLMYEYDFGDGWVHGLKVVKIGPPEPGVCYPRCSAGERACPPEDVGGVHGFYGMLESLADPKHEEHDSYLEWLDGGYDPEAFDVAEVNELLASIR